MKPENELALIVGYYLSRLDQDGYRELGYKTFAEAVTAIGSILGVKKNTIKNMRDEFDPYHQNTRVGWKRPLSPSRAKILASFQDTDDQTLIDIVKEILENKTFTSTEGYSDIHSIFSEKKRSKGIEGYIARGLTGKSAEEAFILLHKEETGPVNGKLRDCRDLGCGYDFEVQNKEHTYYIEVKGIAGDIGGIIFTSKEWKMAKRHQDSYFVVLISNIKENPKITFIKNPYAKLQPKKNVYATIQVNWSVSARDLQIID